MKLKDLFRTRTPTVTLNAAPRMSETDLRLALGISDQHPLWRAVMQLLQDEVDNAISQVSAPDLASKPGPLAHTAGGLEWLRAFQYRLTAARENAMRIQDAERKKGDKKGPV